MMIPGRILKQAGDYLLLKLNEHGSVTYSMFYDGDEETRRELLIGMSMSESDGVHYGAEALIDDAVALFKMMGCVETRELSEELADVSRTTRSR